MLAGAGHQARECFNPVGHNKRIILEITLIMRIVPGSRATRIPDELGGNAALHCTALN